MGNGESNEWEKLFEKWGQGIFTVRQRIYCNITMKPWEYGEMRDSGKKVEIEGHDEQIDIW